MIVIRLDRVLADRKMKLNDLAARVGISNVNLSYLKTGKVRAIRFSTLDAQHPGCDLPGTEMPAGRHPGVCAG